MSNLYSQQKPKPDHFYIIIQEREDFDHIRSFLNVEFGSDKVKRIGREFILQVLERQVLVYLSIMPLLTLVIILKK